LLCGGVFLVADESDLRVVFVPGEFLIFTFAGEKSDEWTIGDVGFDCVGSVGFFVACRSREDQYFGVFADREVEDVAELSFGVGGGVQENEFGTVFFLFCTPGACGRRGRRFSRFWFGDWFKQISDKARAILGDAEGLHFLDACDGAG
jgi:hypothetical protein